MESRVREKGRLLAIAGLTLCLGVGACDESVAGDGDGGGGAAASTSSGGSDPCGCDDPVPDAPYSLECLCAAESVCGGSTTWEGLLERAADDCLDVNVESVVLFGAPESCVGFGELISRDPDLGLVLTALYYDEDGDFVGMWHSEDVENGPCHGAPTWTAGEVIDCAPCLLCGVPVDWLFDSALPDCAEYGVGGQ